MKKLIFLVLVSMVINTINGQELEAYIQEAENNNPEIQAFELKYNISIEKVKGVDFLPNTELSAGYFVSEPETRTGAQKVRISVKQMLPWFGTITARENYASIMSDTQYEDLVIAKRKLIMSVSQSYYRLYEVRAKQKVLNNNIKLLETYKQWALVSLEVGKASAVDVFKLQIRQNELERQKKVLEENYKAERVLFNNLLNRDETTAINVIDMLTIPETDIILDKSRLELHPELIKYDKLYESIDKFELLNQKESAPNLGFGIDYVSVSPRPNMDFIDNGKDIVMPMVSLSISIFNDKYKSLTHQNKLKQQEISAERLERSNRLKSQLEKAIRDRISSRISFDTQTENIERALDAEKILIKNYETGTINFNDILDIQELQLKFQLNREESVRNYYVQSSIINYLSN